MSINYKEPVQNFNPNNKLWFYKSRWFDRTQENNLWFSSETRQFAWFKSHKEDMGASDYTYAIKDYDEYKVTFKVPYSTTLLWNCGYMMRILNYNSSNDTYSDRWFYYIDKATPLSDNSTLIYCTLDVIQTFMFKWILGNQRVLRCHGAYSSSVTDERCFTNEDTVPAFEECSDRQVINPPFNALTPSGSAVPSIQGYAFDKMFLLICTAYYTGAGNDVGDDTMEYVETYYDDLGTSVPSGVDTDASGLFYIVFDSALKLYRYLSWYDGTHDDGHNGRKVTSNDIKGIYGIPLICCGEHVKTLYYDNTKTTVYGYRVKPVYNRVSYQVNIPSSFYSESVVPKVNKTRTTACLSVEARTGENFLLKATDMHITGDTPHITLYIIGILSVSPKVIVLPEEEVASYYKSSNYLTTNAYPIFSVYDVNGDEIYNRNYDATRSKQVLSTLSSIISAVAGVAMISTGVGSVIGATTMMAGGILGTAGGLVSQANTSATYQAPSNMIGNADMSDVWELGMMYLIYRWLTPTKLNMQAFDDYLAINGYNYAGKILTLGNNGSTYGSGVNIFNRKAFCYIQTERCKLVGYQESGGGGNVGTYRSRIEELFDKGIRFWNMDNTPTNYVEQIGVGNYSSTMLNLNNNILPT